MMNGYHDEFSVLELEDDERGAEGQNYPLRFPAEPLSYLVPWRDDSAFNFHFNNETAFCGNEPFLPSQDPFPQISSLLDDEPERRHALSLKVGMLCRTGVRLQRKIAAALDLLRALEDKKPAAPEPSCDPKSQPEPELSPLTTQAPE